MHKSGWLTWHLHNSAYFIVSNSHLPLQINGIEGRMGERGDGGGGGGGGCLPSQGIHNSFFIQAWRPLKYSLLLLLLIRQMETPVSSMKVAVHRKSLRLLYSLRATGVWSGQIPFLSGSLEGQDCSRCSVVWLPVLQRHCSVWLMRSLEYRW